MRQPTVRPCLVPFALALLVCALVAPVQAQRGGRMCQEEGKLEFEVSNKYLIDYEPFEDPETERTWEVLYWSKAIESDNHGIPFTPCSRCQDEDLLAAATAEYDALVADKLAWLEARREVDETAKVKKPIAHVETTHFIVAWGISKVKWEKKSLKMDDAALLFAMRIEQMYERFQKLTGTVDKDFMRTKHHFYFFEKENESRVAGTIYAGMTGAGTVRRSGGSNHESMVIGWRDKSKHPSTEDFMRHWIYNATHQLTACYYNPHWFKPGERGLSPPWLNDKYGWLAAGLAHWFEWDFDGRATNFSFREQDATQKWKGPDWRKNVWKAVQAEAAPDFAEVATKPVEALDVREHQFAYSWVDFLMSREGEGLMGKALQLAKKENPARDILKDAFGISMLSFEREWAEWVTVEYSPTKKDDDRLQPRTQEPVGTPQRGG